MRELDDITGAFIDDSLRIHRDLLSYSLAATSSMASPSGSSIMNARVSPNACGGSMTFTPSRRSFAYSASKSSTTNAT